FARSTPSGFGTSCKHRGSPWTNSGRKRFQKPYQKPNIGLLVHAVNIERHKERKEVPSSIFSWTASKRSHCFSATHFGNSAACRALHCAMCSGPEKWGRTFMPHCEVQHS